MLNRRYYIALGIVVVVTLVLLKLPHRAANQLKLAIGGLFLPTSGLTVSGRELTKKAATAVTSREDLVRQVEKTEKENQELKIKLRQMEELSQENARLRQYF